TEELNLEIAKGKIPGHSTGTIFGRNQDIDPAAEELIWDYGGTEEYLTANTELFLSSDNAGDTNINIFVWGMTDDYAFKQQVVNFTSGQSQQSIGDHFRLFRLVTVDGGGEPLGNIYCAQADTLTGGIPDTSAKVHAFMAQGTNITHKAAGTVPADHTMYVNRLFMGVRRGEDAVIQFRQKPIGYPAFVESSSFPLYQNSQFLTFDPPFVISAKTSFEFTATTVTNNTQVIVNTAYTLVDNTVA
ncbi:MAG: hypothetical protein KAT90_12650, partial [Gammaproteobacteria bacterium]|nr:hypothetical protein [Gammaproteobacteria bacterium]